MTNDTQDTAVVLLSGGIDSATCLGIAADEYGYETIKPVHITYGQQTADIERQRAELLADHYDTEPLTVIDYRDVFGQFAGGVASNRDTFTTDDGDLIEEDGRSTGYVPMRNLHLIATASAIADVNDAITVFIGVQGGDEEAYPDCRKPFIHAAQDAVDNSLADDDDLLIQAPLIDSSKTDVIERASELDVPLEHTYSCYSETDVSDPDPCGECPACVERIEAFDEAGVDDPVMG